MYKAQGGETFAIVSRRIYGNEQQAETLRAANPGVSEPLTAGLSINAPSQAVSGRVNIPEHTAMFIDGREFFAWSDLEITQGVDRISTAEFTTPFSEDNRQIFKPFSFKEIEISTGGKLIFKGTLLSPSPPHLTKDGKVIQVACYGKPGVLQDCTPPPPTNFDGLEFYDVRLDTVVNRLLKPFGIKPIFKASVGAPFEQVAIDPEMKIWSFITKLAKQRMLVVSDDKDGNLVFQQTKKTGKSVAVLTQGLQPLMEVQPYFDPQSYYSSVSGINPTDIGEAGSIHTVRNPRLNGVFRPYTFKTSDNTGASVVDSTKAAAGRMFANMINYNVEISTWFDRSGALWEPNSFVSLLAPDAYVYTEYAFITRSIKLKHSIEGRIAALDLILPGGFDGNIPGRLPWE